MNIPIRTEAELEKLRAACKLAQEVLVMIEPYVKEGVTTGELDRICHQYMRDAASDSGVFKLSLISESNLYFGE